MDQRWTPRVAPSIDAPEARVRSMGWDNAQGWCNFVLLRPADLPDGWVVEETLLRPETVPGRREGDDRGRSPWTTHNRSAHRCVIATSRGHVRVKQFLYDWAPPAFDHPALWRSRVRAFPAGDRVGWLGTDHAGRQAASLQAHRTLVELSVVSGQVADADLVALCRALRPVSDAARRRIDATPLAVLSYAHRHEDTVITVPVGYFRHRRAPQTLRHRACVAPDVCAGLPGSDVVRRLTARYAIDSAFLVGNEAGPQEVDWVLRRHAADADTTIRVLATAAEGEGAIAVPPQVDEQPCSTDRIEVRGMPVDRAWADASVGPHEAVWRQGTTALMLLARPRADADAGWFRALLEDAIAPAS